MKRTATNEPKGSHDEKLTSLAKRLGITTDQLIDRMGHEVGAVAESRKNATVQANRLADTSIDLTDIANNLKTVSDELQALSYASRAFTRDLRATGTVLAAEVFDRIENGMAFLWRRLDASLTDTSSAIFKAKLTILECGAEEVLLERQKNFEVS